MKGCDIIITISEKLEIVLKRLDIIAGKEKVSTYIMNKHPNYPWNAISDSESAMVVRALNTETYEKLGFTYSEYRKLKSQFAYHSNNDRLYYYKDKLFVFGGKKSLVLKTIITLNLNDEGNKVS